MEKALNDAMGIVDSVEAAGPGMDTFETQAKQVAEMLSSKGDEFQEEVESYGEISLNSKKKCIWQDTSWIYWEFEPWKGPRQSMNLPGKQALLHLS